MKKRFQKLYRSAHSAGEKKKKNSNTASTGDADRDNKEEMEEDVARSNHKSVPSRLLDMPSSSEELSTLSFVTGASVGRTSKASPDKWSNTGEKTAGRHASTSVIEPQSDSVRKSMTRVASQLTMNQLNFSNSVLYGREAEHQTLRNIFHRAAASSSPSSSHNGSSSVASMKATEDFRSRQMVVLQGTAGSGKTALALQLKRDVVQGAGFFIRGKFDQYQQEEPYLAFTMACQDLCDTLLVHKEEEQTENNSKGKYSNKWHFTFQEFQEKLKEELPSDSISVLTTIFPNLAEVLGSNFLTMDQASSDEKQEKVSTSSSVSHKSKSGPFAIGYAEAKNRFKYAFCQFMQVVTSFGRVVLLLDDIQFSDAASKDLIKALITDTNTNKDTSCHNDNGLLLLATCRTENLSSKNDPTCTLLQELEMAITESEAEVSNISLHNLGKEQINEMLIDLLNANAQQDTFALAECIHRKTEGNVFYVIQFLKALAADGLLTFHMGSLKWTWDVEQIDLRASSTTNVVEMIQQKLEKLPKTVQRMLPLIACLGESFQYSVFQLVYDNFSDSGSSTGGATAAGTSSDNSEKQYYTSSEFLEICELHGLLFHSKKQARIQWQHDKLQEAALSLVKTEQRLVTIRTNLGEFLLRSFDETAIESNIFMLVHLLLDLDAQHQLEDPARSVMLAELLLTAGDKSMKAAAFTNAATYLSRGITLLSVVDDYWTKHYELSLELYSLAAEAHHCTGEVEATRKFCDAIISQSGIPILDKMRAHIVLVDSINSLEQTLLAQQKCEEVLAMLGCHFPKYGRALRTIGGILKINMSMKALEKEIPMLDIMMEPKKRWIMCFLDRLHTYAYQNKSNLLPLVSLKGFQYTRKYGISEYSPPILTTIGLLLVASFNDLEKGCKFGRMGLNMFETTTSKDQISNVARSSTIFKAAISCLTWQMPNQKLRKLLFDGYKIGLGSGDIESALWSIFVYLELGFHNGLPLDGLEADCAMYAKQMQELKQDLHYLPTISLCQVVSNMRGHSDDPGELDGDYLDLEAARERGGYMDHLERFRLTTTFWSGNYPRTVQVIEEIGADKGSMDEAFPACYPLVPLHFLCFIAYFSVYKETNDKKYKKKAYVHSKKVHDWAKKANINAMHLAFFIDAELLSLKPNNFLKTVQQYREAIACAGRQGILHDQALAKERLGEFYLKNSVEGEAVHHLKQAVKLYEEWGSSCNVFRLKEKYGDILGHLNILESSTLNVGNARADDEKEQELDEES